ncbi:MAG: DUF1566 domain-containing protein [Myxococcales bacterium]|nr:DUF1566 domain-containing protein [Myxococcales bacterium]
MNRNRAMASPRRTIAIALFALLAFAVATGRELSHLWVPAASAAPPPGQFTVEGSNVRDNRTGLLWDRSPYQYSVGSTNSMDAAIARCTDKGEGWRVASLKELLSLVDETHGTSSAFPEPFIIGSGTSFCTSTRSPTSQFNYFYVIPTGDNAGNVFTMPGCDGLRPWCVKNAD